jgi:hypothetical protein
VLWTASSKDEKEEELSEDEYFVEQILARRRKTTSSRRGTLIGYWEYLVKWRGYDKPGDNTWEPAEHLSCKDKLRKFENAHLDSSSEDEGGTQPNISMPLSTLNAPSDDEGDVDCDEDDSEDEDEVDDLGRKKFWDGNHKFPLHPTAHSRLWPNMRLFLNPPAPSNKPGNKGWGVCCYDGTPHCEHNVPKNGCKGKNGCMNKLCDF